MENITKLYLFKRKYNSTEISVEELEVEKITTKMIYIKNYYPSKIPKDSLDKIIRSEYSFLNEKMYSLSPDKKPYISALIEVQAENLVNNERHIVALKEEQGKIHDLIVQLKELLKNS